MLLSAPPAIGGGDQPLAMVGYVRREAGTESHSSLRVQSKDLRAVAAAEFGRMPPTYDEVSEDLSHAERL